MASARQDIPQLGGYDITQPKDAATTALLSDAGDPLLAHWQYGLGRVLAFTSEAGQGWGAQWASWSSFGAFWNQAVRWTMGSPESKVLQPSAQLAGGAGVTASVQQSSVISNTQSALISVESLNADNSFADLASVTAGVKSPSGVVSSTALLQTAPGHYEGQVPLGEPGSYEVLVHRAASDGIEAASEEIGLSVPRAPNTCMQAPTICCSSASMAVPPTIVPMSPPRPSTQASYLALPARTSPCGAGCSLPL